MFVGGAAFSVARQTPGMWATAILCGFISIPVGIFIRIVPNVWVERVFPTRAFNMFLYYVGFGWVKRKKKSKYEEDEESVGGSGDDSGHGVGGGSGPGVAVAAGEDNAKPLKSSTSSTVAKHSSPSNKKA